MSDLLAGLARRALHPRAIKPRLPSRFETAGPLGTSAELELGAESSAPAAGNMASTRVMHAAQHPQPARFAGETGPVPAMRHSDAGPVIKHVAALSDRTQAAPSPIVTATPAGRATAVDSEPVQADRAAQAAVQRVRNAIAELAALNPSTAPARPGAEPPSGPAWPVHDGFPAQPAAPPQRPRVSIVEPQACRTEQRLTPHAHAIAPRRAAPDTRIPGALAGATADPVTRRTQAPAPPPVDITIGSIEIVVTTPAAPVHTAPPPAPATPSVQSLDDYLLARQRRGGPR